MERKLHIGGKKRTPGWEIFDANSGPHVDHVGNAKDLTRFQDRMFAVLYASHVLEHFDYGKELSGVLREWYRVLVQGGKLYVSVPDLDILCQLFLMKDKLDVQERFFVMRMMFGGHVDKYDYHYSGLNYDFLTGFLGNAGFENITRVDDFGLFEDSSTMRFRGVPISLNVAAIKPLL